MVRLEEGKRGSRGFCLRDGARLDVGEGFAAIDLWLAGAEKVEVGAVEE